MAKTTDTKKDDKKSMGFVTPKFRVSYPYLFQPQKDKDDPEGAGKYSITMMFPKETDLTDLKKSLHAAKVAAFGPNKEKWPKKLESPVRDGDSVEFEDKPEFQGCWIVKATANAKFGKPSLVGTKRDIEKKLIPLGDQSEFYAGCYARAFIFPNVWEFMKKRGVSFILDHVQKLDDGPALGGRKNVNEIFDPIGDDDVESNDFADDAEEEQEF